MTRPSILLVDDDRRVRQLVGLTLSPDEFDLTFAEDGADAIRAAHQRQPDLILLDYAMPGIHGVEVCKVLRSDPETATTPIIMLTGHGDDDTRELAERAGASGFLTKPFSPLSLAETIRSLLSIPRLTVLGAIDMHRPAIDGSPGRSARPDRPPRGIEPDSSPTVRVSSDPGPPPGQVTQGRADHSEALLSTLEAVATALELRGVAVEGHAQRVSVYAVAAARHLGVDDDEIDQIRWGAILHDIGLIGMPDAIVLKPSPLSPEEFAMVREHPEQGARLLDSIPGIETALSIVRFHHERFDGTGYPLGLRGTAIPLGARIFAVADAIDAITTSRPHRPARTWEQARVEILEGRSTHFDPTVVDAFLEIFDEINSQGTGALQVLSLT